MLLLVMTLTMATEPQLPPVELTRTEELRIAREEKAQHLEPPTRTFLEKGLHQLKEGRLMQRFKSGIYGFHPLVGGMKSGSGFALGTTYSAGKFKATSQVSLKGYQRYEVALSAPRFLSEHLFAGIRAEYRNYVQEDFFGVGQDSRSEDHANYRQEDRILAGEIGLRLNEHIKIGGNIGWIDTMIGEGTQAGIPTLGQTSYAQNLEAFDEQPRYVETAAFVDIDNRDEPGNPRAGGRYMAKWSRFDDRSFRQYGFDRFEVEVQHYFPFLNQRRVIALRAKTALTQTANGQEVPFYILPSLGGSQDLRGFSEYRFRDRNLAVFNAEYRWEAFSGLDMALFLDAGQVAARFRDFHFSEMKTAAGMGFRFNTAKAVFCRVDVGFSQEGPRLFLNFGHVF